MPGMTGCALQGGTLIDDASEVPHCHANEYAHENRIVATYLALDQ